MIYKILIFSTCLFIVPEIAHTSGKHEASTQKSGEDSHSDEDAANVGPDKGIIEFSERRGFKLSSEALKNFDLKFLKLTGDGPWKLPKSVILYSAEETNLFRKRNGYFKRIDFQTISSTQNDLTVDSDDLREDDEVVISGLGFLRIAELAATGGVSHGHSH